jgi:hypothetical protein
LAAVGKSAAALRNWFQQIGRRRRSGRARSGWRRRHLARLRRDVEHRLGERDARRAVDRRVVHLGVVADRAALQALDDVQRPQRPVTVE